MKMFKLTFETWTINAYAVISLFGNTRFSIFVHGKFFLIGSDSVHIPISCEHVTGFLYNSFGPYT